MNRDIIDLASDLARRGEPFALAVVVARKPPISAKVGDTALVTRDGGFHGWVGGSCTRPTVVAEAKKALANGRPRMVALGPESELDVSAADTLFFPMNCHSGGSVQIHIQPVLPRARLVIYGVSPVSSALSRLAQAMDYDVYGCDKSADGTDFPGARTVATNPADLTFEKGYAPLFAVVATHGEWDEEAVLAALAHAPDYLGIVASRKRFAVLSAFVTERMPNASLSCVRNPAGLDIGAVSPEEIAVSILAEIVKERRREGLTAHATGADPSDARVPGQDGQKGSASRKLRLAQATAPAEARDPVCGMTVRIEGARFRAAHGEKEFFFCCAGCRDRFSAAPERYLAAGAET